MSLIALKPDGTLSNVPAPDDILQIDAETFNALGPNIEVKVAFTQTDDGDFTPENTRCRLQLIDIKTDDVIFNIAGNLLDDDENLRTLAAAAHASKEFSVFEIQILNEVDFHTAISASLATNLMNEIQRKAIFVPWESQSPESNIDDIYDIVTTSDNPPKGIYMVLGENLKVFTEALRIAQKLNIPLTVELPPDLEPDVAVQIAEELQIQDHRVRIIWNMTVSRPNNVTSIAGKLKPRYAIGTLMGRVMKRNSTTNSNGIPPLHRLCAGYDFPFNWKGIAMRKDVKLTDPLRKKLAKARINPIYREVYRAGVRYILGDVQTQYDLKEGSPLQLENSSDISMFVDNTCIEIAREELLKPQSEFIKRIYDKITDFLDKCTDKDNQLLVQSEDLGGQYYQLSVTPRSDRPNDACDISVNYRPEGATRAVFFNTAVYAK
ncbi:hypothetical protein [Acinetobacter colistiniresistens]|uniref:hypothetical protein n=1 Tax=Acinetobacter colistiniresistens TaxID=280145 RepID=UPI0012509241|nr:hypothetical protein [Acinetobacter colistiniresistens]